jgi:hypothetical protein
LTLDLSNREAAGDAALERLSQLRSLQDLNLRGAPVTDAGLMHLKSIESLRTLNLQLTRVTPAGLRMLQEAIPRCRIIPP